MDTQYSKNDDPSYCPKIIFETGLGPVTDKLLNTIFEKITTKDFKEKIAEKIVDPVTEIINEKIQPYVYISMGLYIILIILLLVIIYLLLVRKR